MNVKKIKFLNLETLEMEDFVILSQQLGNTINLSYCDFEKGLVLPAEIKNGKIRINYLNLPWFSFEDFKEGF